MAAVSNAVCVRKSTVMLKKLSVGLAVTLLVTGLMASQGSERMRGEASAKSDIAHGRYRELTYGLPGPGRLEYTRVLRERYGIEVRVVAGCVVPPTLIDYVAGYNSVSMAAAKRKFGRNVFREAGDEARRTWRARAGGASQ